jgi:hypothetical protein
MEFWKDRRITAVPLTVFLCFKNMNLSLLLPAARRRWLAACSAAASHEAVLKHTKHTKPPANIACPPQRAGLLQ